MEDNAKSIGITKEISDWMDILRGTAVCAVVVHHWILFSEHESRYRMIFNCVKLIGDACGTFVHLFFIVSGLGLTISCLRKPSTDWRSWWTRRAKRIIIPYLLVISLTYLFVETQHIVWPETFKITYHWPTLLSYLTFLRNFYPPGWGLNLSYWFMPVIIGFYFIFPLMLMILRKYGPWKLFIISFAVTYVSISLSIAFGLSMEHQAAMTPFHLVEFALGMILGYALITYPEYFHNISVVYILTAGIILYCLSWAMVRFINQGDAYNDLLTAIGLLLLTTSLYIILSKNRAKRVVSAMNKLSKQSYLMYLFHWALIVYLIKPVLKWLSLWPLQSSIILILALPFSYTVFALSSLLEGPFERISSHICNVGKTKIKSEVVDT